MSRKNRQSVLDAARAGNLDLLNDLLEKANFNEALLFIEVESCNRDVGQLVSKCTPLSLASSCGHINVVKWISKHYRYVSSLECGSPLHVACIWGEADCARYLTETFPHFINATDAEGHRPIQLAAGQSHFQIVKNLAESGAIVDAYTAPISVCQYPYGLPMFRGDIPAISIASILGHMEMLELLLQHGANPLMIVGGTKDETSPLLHATKRGNLEVIKRLHKVVPFDEKYGAPAVHEAARYGSLLCLQFLLENGAPTFNCLVRQEELWLHVLQDEDFYSQAAPKVIQLLFDRGATWKSLTTTSSVDLREIFATADVPNLQLLMKSGILELRHYVESQYKRDFRDLLQNFEFHEPTKSRIILSHFPVRVDMDQGLKSVYDDRNVSSTRLMGSNNLEEYSDADATVNLFHLWKFLDSDRLDRAINGCFNQVASLSYFCRWTIRCRIAMKHGFINSEHIKQLKLPPLLSRYLYHK